MFELIDTILQKFRVCFNRESTFYWFCVIVFGMMIRPDFRGVTSIVGVLNLSLNAYNNMLHFFRSTAYKLESLKTCWIQIILKQVKIKELSGYLLCIGDHSKIVKEARHMPGVKKHHQDSDNSGKGEYIYGHEFGMIGMLTESCRMQCLPVDIELHDGADDINELTKNKALSSLEPNVEHVAEIEQKVVATTKKVKKRKGKAIKTKKIKDENKVNKRKKKAKEKSKNERIKNIKKKKNTSSSANKLMNMLERLVNRTGKAILIVLDAGFATGDVFKKVFEINKKAGTKVAAVITRSKSNYVGCMEPDEKTEKTSGRPAKYGDSVAFYSFFEDIITAYTYRFKIEVAFKELKHTLGSFCYHFWTSVMPKLYKFKTTTDLSAITDKLDISKIMATVKAIETFTFLGCISFGILTIIANEFPNAVWKNFSGWLRTKTSQIPSNEVTRVAIRNIYILNKLKVTRYATFKIISKFQAEDLYEYDEYCA